MKIIISIVLAFCCLPFVAAGAYEIFQNMRELNAFSRTNGTIVGNDYSLTNTDGNVSGAYHPVVEFIDGENNKIKFTDSIGSLPPDYEPNSPVAVVFDAKKPQNARIHSWKRFWLATTIFIAVGILPLIVWLFLARRLNF